MLPPFFLLQSLQNEVVERRPSMDRLEVLMEIISTECKHQFSVCNQVSSTFNTLKSLMDDLCMKVWIILFFLFKLGFFFIAYSVCLPSEMEAIPPIKFILLNDRVPSILWRL